MAPQPGTPGSAYFDFLSPNGENVPIAEAIYDFQFVSWSNRGGQQERNGPILDPIASFTFSSLEGARLGPAIGSQLFAFMNWNESFLGGSWSIGFSAPLPFVSYSVSPGSMEAFWPINYFFNEQGEQGGFLFAGTRNVPESGEDDENEDDDHGGRSHVPDAASTLTLLGMALGALGFIRHRI